MFSNLYFHTCKINNVNDEGIITSTGTGFFINTGIIIDGVYQTLIVTNKHVVDFTSTFLLIKFHTRKKISNNDDAVLETIDINIYGFLNRFKTYTDENIDLGTIDITDLIKSYSLYMHIIDIKNVFHSNYACNIAEPKAYFIGYPKGIIDEINNFPLLSSGIISTHLIASFNNSRTFLLDATVLPGSSGSPVFIITQNLKSQEYQFTLFGIITGTLLENAELQKYLLTKSISYVNIYSNIGVGIRSDLLIEHINLYYNNNLNEELLN